MTTTTKRKLSALPGVLAAGMLLTSIGAETAHAQAAAVYPHIWAAHAPTYQRLPDDAPLDPNSTAIIQNIKRYGIEQWGDRARGLPSMNLNTHSYSAPFWVATNADPAYDIKFVDCQRKGATPREFEELRGVNIPDRARPSAGTDSQLSVYNRDTGRYVDLWVSRSGPTDGTPAGADQSVTRAPPMASSPRHGACPHPAALLSPTASKRPSSGPAGSIT